MHTDDIRFIFFKAEAAQGVNTAETTKTPTNCLHSFLSLGPNEREASRRASSPAVVQLGIGPGPSTPAQAFQE